MPKVSKRLRISNEQHPTLGEIIQLYSPADADGTAAFFIDEEETAYAQQYSNGRPVHPRKIKPAGVGIRLTYKTAQKLGKILLDITSPKRKGNA